MGVIPGWDSVAGSRWWSNIYFWGSIGALILLGITEVVSHRYSQREDELSAIEQEAAKKTHEDEIAQLHVEAANANERAARLEKEAALLRLQLDQEVQKRAPRFLTDEQKAAMLDELRGKIQEIMIVVQNDPEAQAFAMRYFFTLFQDAGAKVYTAERRARINGMLQRA